jgi:hypothetical protein
MIGTFAIGTMVALVLLLGMVNLKSFAGPNYQELALLTNVLHLVQEHYVTEVDEHTLIEGLDVLDPHTSYLSKEFYKEVQLDTKGEFEGLGTTRRSSSTPRVSSRASGSRSPSGTATSPSSRRSMARPPRRPVFARKTRS